MHEGWVSGDGITAGDVGDDRDDVLKRLILVAAADELAELAIVVERDLALRICVADGKFDGLVWIGGRGRGPHSAFEAMGAAHPVRAAPHFK